ncbi:MAG: LysR family transcriptional regulator [Planctomycetaceae bacterium]|nr:LysR family transcriptional regulator [Planctomycetaceae bacterium]
MDFKALHYVIAVAENGSISSAAKKLGISQPSLTNYLHRVADELGAPLFERGDRGYVPTYAGERFIAYARQIQSIAGELDNLSPRENGKTVRVTLPPFEGSFIHPFAIRRFRETHPDVNLMLIESNDTAEILRNGQADFAITATILPGNEFTQTLLVQDEILLVTANNHPIESHSIWKPGCQRPWVDVNLLVGEPFIRLFPYQHTRMLSDALLERENIQPKVLMQTRSVLTSIRVAATGAGVCFAPSSGIRDSQFPESPAFYSVGDPVVMDVYFTKLKYSHLDDAASDFATLITDFTR